MASTYHELLAGHAAIRLFAYRYSIKSYSMIVVVTGELNVCHTIYRFFVKYFSFQ